MLQLAERYGQQLLLPKVVLAIYDNLDICSRLRYDRQQLWANLVAAESLYYVCNPYHNALHAADVAVSVFGIVQRDAAKLKPTLEEKAAMVYAAAVHDMLHTGRVTPTTAAAAYNMLASGFPLLLACPLPV